MDSPQDSLNERREKILLLFNSMADAFQADHSWIYSVLRTISPSATASDEISKTIRALRTYGKELDPLKSRVPFGGVAVSLPFNNPLYSLILYAFGPMLGGSAVVVRPSGLTSAITHQLYERHRRLFEQLPLTLVSSTGADFLAHAINSPKIQTLLFTGSYDHLETLDASYPSDKALIYCGSGINPFLVTPDAFAGIGGASRIADLAIRSRTHNSGQDCLCAERFYVHDDLFALFITELVAKVRSLRVGQFDDESADIVPLMGNLPDRLSQLLSQDPRAIFHLRGSITGSLVQPYIIEVPIDSQLLNTEKYGPVFVLARYSDATQLDAALDVEYRFGATVCGSYWSAILDSYPHTTSNTSVVEAEAEDAHVPFGGRMKSGFVRRQTNRKDGPILFSVETTEPKPYAL